MTTPAGNGALVLTFAFATDTLPHLQVWRDLRPHAGVLGIEPCTSERTADARSGPEPILQPGERRRYRLRLSVSSD